MLHVEFIAKSKHWSSTLHTYILSAIEKIIFFFSCFVKSDFMNFFPIISIPPKTHF